MNNIKTRYNMKYSSFAACIALFALGLSACQVEEQNVGSPEVAEPCMINCTMSATMPEFKAGGDPETRSSLESVVRVKWKKNDELSVINLTTGKQLGGCIKADKDGANSTFSPSNLHGSITAGDKLVFLLDNDPNHRSANEKDFEPFTMDYSSQKGNSNEVPIVVYANYTATANGIINAVNPEFNFLMGYVQLAVSALPASTSVTELGIENLNTKCHFSISNNAFVTTPQNGNITLSEAFTANSKGTNTRYFSCFTSPAQGAARNAHINANSQNHITAWLKAALSAGYYYQSVATGFTNENISFVDDTFKSYCVSHYDKNGDGEVSFAEAAAVTSFESFSASEKSSLKEVYELPYFFKGERIPDFGGCTALKQVLLPGTLQTIQANAFKGCTALEEITAPSNVTTVGEGAFEGCTSLERFNGALASADRRYLVKDNHVLAFAPAGLTETTVPDGITTINAGVFANNTTITTVNLPAALTTVEARAFKGCTALPIIRFRANIANIGEDAFKGCSSLRSVYSDAVVPPAVGSGAFSNCHASLAAHVTSGNLCAYEANSSWSALNVTTAQPWNEIWYTTTDGNKCDVQILYPHNKNYISNTYVDGKGVLFFNEDLTESSARFLNCVTLDSIKLPDSVKSIEGHAFHGCSALSSVTLPTGLISIGEFAFSNCTSLVSIDLPEDLESIGEYAFNSSGLVSIVLPDATNTIGKWAFNECSSLNSITLPDSLESVGEYAFRQCNALNAIYANPLVLAKTDFSNEYSNPLRIGHNLYSKGPNPELITSVVVPEGLTAIAPRAFYGCTSITAISIPPSIQTIGEEAFYECDNISDVFITDLVAWCNIDFASNPIHNSRLFLSGSILTALTIPQSITSIKRNTFKSCSSIETVVIPSSVTSIGDHAFYRCNNLTSIFIPNTVESIGESAFGETKLSTLDLPNSISTIPSNMCIGCTNLESISLPDNLLSIGFQAFHTCSKLTTITIPASVVSIDNGAFWFCDQLQSIYIKATTPPDGPTPTTNNTSTYYYVPLDAEDIYKEAWPSLASKILGYNFE